METIARRARLSAAGAFGAIRRRARAGLTDPTADGAQAGQTGGGQAQPGFSAESARLLRSLLPLMPEVTQQILPEVRGAPQTPAVSLTDPPQKYQLTAP